MTKQTSAGALALLLAVGAVQAGCTGSIDPLLSSQGGSSAVQAGSATGTPDGGGVGGKDAPSGLGTQVFALCSGGSEAPSPRLLRLLTRREYRNTVESLLFVHDTALDSLPIEPRVRGYDNNAGASVVTSRHVDEYMTASDGLVKRALAEQRTSSRSSVGSWSSSRA